MPEYGPKLILRSCLKLWLSCFSYAAKIEVELSFELCTFNSSLLNSCTFDYTKFKFWSWIFKSFSISNFWEPVSEEQHIRPKRTERKKLPLPWYWATSLSEQWPVTVLSLLWLSSFMLSEPLLILWFLLGNLESLTAFAAKSPKALSFRVKLSVFYLFCFDSVNSLRNLLFILLRMSNL